MIITLLQLDTLVYKLHTLYRIPQFKYHLGFILLDSLSYGLLSHCLDIFYLPSGPLQRSEDIVNNSVKVNSVKV